MVVRHQDAWRDEKSRADEAFPHVDLRYRISEPQCGGARLELVERPPFRHDALRRQTASCFDMPQYAVDPERDTGCRRALQLHLHFIGEERIGVEAGSS